MLQFVATGVVFGSILAVTASGLSLVYAILKLTNFAHGDMVTFGAYVALFLNLALGLDVWWTLPLAFIAGALLAVALDGLVWAPMRRRGAGTVAMMIASIGVALALRNALVFLFGADTTRFDMPVQPKVPLGSLPVMMSADDWEVIVAAAVAILGLHLLLTRTAIGRAMRALSDNAALAWVSGVDVDRVIRWTWIVGGGLAGAGGVLYGMTQPFNTNMGWFLLLPIFAAIIVGGIGNPYGAILGGLLIGVAQEVSVAVLPTQYRLAVGFVVMILVLLVYPRGLLGQRSLS
ncbi:MAG: branched-chain amino acid ABC transporter permease [Clostridia bacterium]|nr:branched-chain amino acid ABC transporter permease [Clostridia bacterium]